jgi:murein L,D-transpeptidase YafK
MNSCFIKVALVFGLVMGSAACAPDSQNLRRGSAPEAGDIVLVRVEKGARRLVLFDASGAARRTFEGIQFGAAPQGHKQFEGDERTPEGRYTIDYGNPRSAYHLSLHISYPNAADRAFAESRGKSAGGEIFIHGQPNALRMGRVPGDWTNGCIALSNKEIEDLWVLIRDGTPIEISS